MILTLQEAQEVVAQSVAELDSVLADARAELGTGMLSSASRLLARCQYLVKVLDEATPMSWPP